MSFRVRSSSECRPWPCLSPPWPHAGGSMYFQPPYGNWHNHPPACASRAPQISGDTCTSSVLAESRMLVATVHRVLDPTGFKSGAAEHQTHLHQKIANSRCLLFGVFGAALLRPQRRGKDLESPLVRLRRRHCALHGSYVSHHHLVLGPIFLIYEESVHLGQRQLIKCDNRCIWYDLTLFPNIFATSSAT